MHLIQRMAAPSSSRPAQQQVRLIAERRLFLKRRWRATAEDGTEFGFDLESRLISGCVIHQSETHDYVIWQQSEPVYSIPFSNPEQAALIGWRIGNLHFPVQILSDRLLVTTDLAIKQLIERENWPHEETEAVFTPLRVIAHAA
jgi:urease accessory protein